MELLTMGEDEKSPTQLSRGAGFSPGTTHRILDALRARGYVRQNPSNHTYRASFKLFEMGNTAVRVLSVREDALPVMRELTGKTGESSFLNIVDNDECLCLAKEEGPHHGHPRPFPNRTRSRAPFAETDRRVPGPGASPGAENDPAYTEETVPCAGDTAWMPPPAAAPACVRTSEFTMRANLHIGISYLTHLYFL